jgi:hypothetical protein
MLITDSPSTPEQCHQERERHADHDGRRDGHVERIRRPADDDVAGQPADGNTQPEQQAGGGDDEPDD